MSTGSSQSSARPVRIVTLVLGALFVGYAVSDHPMYGGEPGFGKAQMGIAAAGVLIAACALLPKAWNTRIVLATCSGLFMLLVAELGLNLVLSHRYRPPYEHHERYLFRLRPGAWAEWTHPPVNGGHTILYRINSDGFRGDELLEKGAAQRVLVYGDSFIHAFYTPQEETFTEVLEAELAKKLGSEVEVINAGTASFGPDQLVLRMEDELPVHEPAHVVLAVFAGNDFGDLMRNKMYRLDAQGNLKPNDFQLSPRIRTKLQLNHSESILKRAIRRATQSPPSQLREGAGKQHSDPRVALMDEWLAEAQAEYKSLVVDGNDVITNTQVDRYNADSSLTPNADSSRYKAGLMEGVLKRAQSVAKKHGVGLTLLFIPHPVDVAEDTDHGKVETARFPDYRRRNLTDTLTGIATRNGIAFVDLFDTFRERDASALYYHGGDDHWNSEGQKLAAQIVATQLVKDGRLAAQNK
ncbi:MAG: hypothetical protein OXT09_32765 [Myxococcales bacterium]|nr:hypothetical protein [Myxococcales bacterium]